MRGDDSGRGGEAVQVERGNRTSPVSAAGTFAHVSEAAGPPEP
ncbi:hypothetical protein [Nonomuraea phyllanthi]|nr:hypothetical protein [Nonomuraea phyllanthi]